MPPLSSPHVDLPPCHAGREMKALAEQSKEVRALAKRSATETGQWGEDIACAFLKLKGLEILDRNYRVGRWELDIVARDASDVVFVEVKLRRRSDRGGPLGAVARKKRLDLARAAACYISRRKIDADSYRFDVISILIVDRAGGMTLRHIEGAFDCSGHQGHQL